MRYFPPIVWQLLIGMMFSRTASFMTLPFLAIYMQNELQAPALLIGLAVGISPLTSTFGGFIGGFLTDKFGPKQILLISLVGWMMAFFGFAWSQSVWLFIVWNALNGLSRAFFEPSSQALMIAFTPQEKRRRLFSIRYMMINFAAVIGPLVGVYIAQADMRLSPFTITAFIYIACLLFFASVAKNPPTINEHAEKQTVRLLCHTIMSDRVLLSILLASVLASFVYSQTDSTLSQLLNMTMADGIRLFSILIAVNAVTVVVLQLPLSIVSEKISVYKSLLLGSAFTIIGMILFAVADTMWLFALAMFIISLGEIFIFPIIGVIIEMIAPEHAKASYLGALQFQNLGGFFGPIAGSWLLVHFISSVYIVMALIGCVMLLCFIVSLRGKSVANSAHI